MGNYDKTFNTICRICLKHEKMNEMLSLIDPTSETGLSTHGVSFEIVTKKSVRENEYLPTNICQTCTKSLEITRNFLDNCEINEKRLSKLITFSLKQDLTGEMVKEVVCQYTLFNQYFPEESKAGSSKASTSYDCPETRSINKSRNAKIEDTASVKVEVRRLSQCSSEDNFEPNESTTQIDSDNVDLFLDSIERLVTNKMNPDDAAAKRQVKKAQLRNLTCNICQKTLANAATYENHMQRHKGCRYICDQCGKGFPVRAELSQHQIARHGIGPYLECDHCSFKACRRIELIEHIRLHTGERPFTCEKCGLTFRRKAIWTNHIKCHKEKSISCQYCPRKFIRRSEMLAHSNNIHNRMYLYLCKICNVTYAKAQTVRKHLLIKHGIPREMQGKIVRINKEANSSLFRETKTGDNEFGDV